MNGNLLATIALFILVSMLPLLLIILLFEAGVMEVR